MTDCSCESSPMRHEPGCPVEDRLVDLTAHVGQTPDGALVATETGDMLRHVAALVEQTKNLDYNPSESGGVWVCGDHGVPECRQDDCAALPWPEPNFDPVLGAFQEWADREFLRVVRPYDEGHVSEMPDESFRSYSVSEWPVGDLLAVVLPPGSERGGDA